jgi:hypothetical protein
MASQGCHFDYTKEITQTTTVKQHGDFILLTLLLECEDKWK